MHSLNALLFYDSIKPVFSTSGIFLNLLSAYFSNDKLILKDSSWREQLSLIPIFTNYKIILQLFDF